MVFNTVIAEEQGQKFRGYLSIPKLSVPAAGAPCLILMHEVYGVTPGLTKMADTFAELGFLTLCPNMYWQLDENASFRYQGPNEPLSAELEHDRDAARDNMFEFVNFTSPEDGEAKTARVLHSIDLAARFLREHDLSNGKVASSGMCFGARNSYVANAAGGIVDAGVAFYATPKLAEVFRHEDAMAIKTPFMFVVGGEDPYITDDEKEMILKASSFNVVYAAGLKQPLFTPNHEGNANIACLYYTNSNHGWNRSNSVYSDQGTSDHTIRAAAEFLHAALNDGKFRFPDAARTTPQSETYHPRPKL